MCRGGGGGGGYAVPIEEKLYDGKIVGIVLLHLYMDVA